MCGCNGHSKVPDNLNEDGHTHRMQMVCPKKEMLIHPLVYKNGSPVVLTLMVVTMPMREGKPYMAV